MHERSWKQRYRAHCAHEPTVPIFSKDWWLDAVAGGANWDVVLAERGNKIVASLPYVKRKRGPLTLLIMPKLTQTLGPWLQPSEAKYAKQLSEQKGLLTTLIEQLPGYDLFYQNFHYSITNWLPFYWHDFKQTTRYTYVLEGISSPDAIWSGFRANIRTDIRKAEKQLIVRDDLELDKFIQIHALTFERQGKSLPYSAEIIRRVDAACKEHNARRILFAADPQERIHAAVYIIWDEQSAYYLMGGANPGLRNSGATSLLLWEAIKFMAGVTERFDFEGSMLEPVERFFRAFGARQIPYFNMRNMSKRMSILWAGRDLVQAILPK